MILRALVAATLIVATITSAARAQAPRPTGNTNTPGYDIAKYTNTLVLKPFDEAGKVAQVAIKALEGLHYSRNTFGDAMSVKAFDRFLDAMDPQKIYFLASDYDEFEPLRNTLQDQILRRRDLKPVYEIFNRWLRRFDQQYEYVNERLLSDKFEFAGTDRVQLNRKDEPRPKDLAEVQLLWRERLRSEYLNERLNDPELKPTLKIVADAFRSNRVSELPTLLTNKVSVEKAGDLAQLARDAGGSDQAVAAIEARLKSERTGEIRTNLVRRYNRTLRFLKQQDSEEVLQLFLDAVSHAYDPHTDYFGKKELDNFAIQMNLALFGIGATLQDRDGYTTVYNIVTNSPVQRSGLIKTNDRIVAVAQEGEPAINVIDEKLSRVVDMIRGPKGTKVHLTLWPGNTDPSVRKEVTLVRDEVKLEDAEAKAQLIELPTSSGKTVRLGVIYLPSFYTTFPVGAGGRATTPKSTTGDVTKLVKKMLAEGAQGLVLDLRGNGGGSLEESIRLTGLFIKEGPVVQVKNFDGKIKEDSDPDGSILYDGPLVVLTSRSSASASEIVAGALQDYGRALLVGDISTHGKGTVQTIQELGAYLPREDVNPGAVKVTIRKFYRPSGSSTQLKGVIPDIILPSVNNYYETGESSLTNALPWDTIRSAQFDRVDRVAAYLPVLKEKSAHRLATSKDWDWVQEDIERFRKQLAEKSVSLNQVERLKERDENKTRARTRKKELAARKVEEPRTWELTVKMTDRDGLPDPVVRTNVIATSRSDLALLKLDAANGTSDEDEEPAEGEAPGTLTDLGLREAERILLDYADLLAAPKKETALKP